MIDFAWCAMYNAEKEGITASDFEEMYRIATVLACCLTGLRLKYWTMFNTGKL